MALELLAASLALNAIAAGVGALVVRWPAAGLWSAAAGATAGAVATAAAALWLADAPGRFVLPLSTPLGAFLVRATPLGGLLLLVTGVVGGAISLYAAAYTAHIPGPRRQATCHVLANLALAAVAVLAAAGDAVTFLIAWEVMVLATFVLVTVEFDRRGRPPAAFLYLALAEIGFVPMVVGFALLGALRPGAGFAALAQHPQVTGGVAAASFCCFLVGFGVKAGLLPLQGWLPEAHPAAPANISALLSGVVVTTGIYGLALTGFVLLPQPAWWWGYLVLALGVASAAYGVLFSLLVPQLKRLLACSTIENLGFMVAMLGTALIFRAAHQPLLAATSLLVALLHALYHALLKSTLFMGAGAVDVATGVLDVDRLGGLARRMRWTTVLVVVGAMGLAGVPPLGGFQTEWLGLQVLIRSRVLASPEGRVALAGAGMLLTLTFALAVTTYVRLVGGAFLGRPRSREARHAVEVPAAMRLGMGVTAAAAVATALVPPLGIAAAAAAAAAATHVHGLQATVLPPFFTHPGRFALPVRLGGGFLGQILPVGGLTIVPTSFRYAFIAPTYLACTLAAVVGLTAALLRLLARPRRREAPVWTGAGEEATPAMQYTATAFTNLFRSVFGGVFRGQRQVEGTYHQAPYFARSIHYRHRVVEPIASSLYTPAVAAARWIARQAGRLQSGSLSLYLLYLVVVFIIVLFAR